MSKHRSIGVLAVNGIILQIICGLALADVRKSNNSLIVKAEGVETEGQLSGLGKMDCDELQDFLLSRPITREKLEDSLKSSRREVVLKIENATKRKIRYQYHPLDGGESISFCTFFLSAVF